MRMIVLCAVLATSFGLASCGQTTGERTLSGAGIGAAGGAILGAIGGAPGLGAAVGAGAGALGGLLYDQQKKGNVD